MDQTQLREMIAAILKDLHPEGLLSAEIPVEISARHVHFSADDFQRLFGPQAVLEKQRDISQPGQFISGHRVRLIGPRGILDRVAVLGPVRNRTQVEISATDAVALGIKPPVRLSGNLDGGADLHIQAGSNLLFLPHSTIVAARHLHMTPADAHRFGVRDGQTVDVQLEGTRPLLLRQVTVRVDDNAALGLHIDCDEANAAGIGSGGRCRIVYGFGPGLQSADEKREEGNPLQRVLDLPPEERGPVLVTEELVLSAARDRYAAIRTVGKAIVTPSASDALRANGIRWIDRQEQ